MHRRLRLGLVGAAFFIVAGCNTASEPANVGPNGEPLIATNVRMQWETEGTAAPETVRVYLSFSGDMTKRVYVGEATGHPLDEPLVREWWSGEDAVYWLARKDETHLVVMRQTFDEQPVDTEVLVVEIPPALLFECVDDAGCA